MREITFGAAILEAQQQLMEKDKRVFLMGEGVDDPKGVFGTTLGLREKFGPDRVFDLPLAENGFTGIGVGAALGGMRPIIVHQRMDFLLLAMDQICNHAAKWRYMSGGRVGVPLTIRAIIGRGWGQAAQHSQSLQALFMHMPGLKVVMPSNAYDAKGLLIASVEDDDPVLFIEHRWLHNKVANAPEEMYSIPLGKGAIVREGRDVTVVATSHMMFEATQAAQSLADEGIDVELVDPRTLKPLDDELIFASVRKTGRLVVADTGWRTCGVGAEIAARVVGGVFDYLRAPVVRVSLPDVPTPCSSALEAVFYPDPQSIISAVKRVLFGERVEDRLVMEPATIEVDPFVKQFRGPF